MPHLISKSNTKSRTINRLYVDFQHVAAPICSPPFANLLRPQREARAPSLRTTAPAYSKYFFDQLEHIVELFPEENLMCLCIP